MAECYYPSPSCGFHDPRPGGSVVDRSAERSSRALSVLKNSGAAGAAQIVTALAGYLLLYAAARLLGRVGVGTLGVLISFTLVGQILAGSGLGIYLARQVAQDREERSSFGSTLLLGALVGIVVVGVIYVASLVNLLPTASVGPIRVAMFAIIPGGVAMVCEGFLQGRERIILTAGSNVVEGIFRVVLAVVLLKLGYGVMGVAVAIVIARIFGAGLDLWIIAGRLGARPQLPAPDVLRATALASLPLGGIFLMTTVFIKGDVLILARLAGEAQTGLFVAGLRPVEVAGIIPMSLVNGLYPVLSRQMAGGQAVIRDAIQKTFIVVVAMMAGVAVGLWAESGLVVRILYPASFEPSARILAITAWSLLPTSFDAVTVALLLARGKFGVASINLLIGTVLLAGINLAVDGSHGAIGAALARPVALSVLAVLNLRLTFRDIFSVELAKALMGVALSALALALVLTVLRPVPQLAIPVGVVFFPVALILTGVLRRRDLELLTRLLGRGSAATPAPPS